MSERMPFYGGQAVLEGVMMRGRWTAAVAVRAPDQQIIIHKERLGEIYRSHLVKIPFVRGILLLWDALGLGMRALTISANVQTGEDQKLEGPALFLTLGFSLVFAVGFFFLVPAAIGHFSASFLSSLFPQAGSFAWTGNLIEGLVRLFLLIGYIWIIGRIPEIRRVFAYHGAEHKTINAFEAGAELTPASVSRFPLEHPRCGTSFLLTLVVLSVFLFSLLGPLPLAWRFIARILMIPLLAGIAYEYIRWTARYLHLPFVRWIVRPNLALQRLTTREPTLDMLEVSIAAFQTMKAEEDRLVA